MDDNVVPFSDRSLIEDQAAAWLIKLDVDEPFSKDQLTALRAWLDTDSRHGVALAELARLWDRMDALEQLAVPLGRPGGQWLSSLGDYLRAPRVAAVACSVLIICVITFAFLTKPTVILSEGIADGTFATAVGVMEHLSLADGSRIELNTDTRLMVSYTPTERAIHLLQGEAHFVVASQKHRPFVVYTNIGAVRAVGTAFRVRVLKADVEVTVAEGIVDLDLLAPKDAATGAGNSRSSPVVQQKLGKLVAGQSTRFTRIKSEPRAVQQMTAAQIARTLSWRNGELTLSGEPLEEVVHEVSRYTDIDIVIVDPKIRDLRIGGVFRTGETEALLDILATSFGIRITSAGDGRIELNREPG